MTLTATAIAAPVAPRPLAYQHRARLLCALCFNGLDMRPRPYGGAVIPIPIPATGRPAVARRLWRGAARTGPVRARRSHRHRWRARCL